MFAICFNADWHANFDFIGFNRTDILVHHERHAVANGGHEAVYGN
jgi:hypothetical protein